MTDQIFSYEEVPYSSFTFPQTRPDRLATLAAIHGMDPAPPDKCRVLELGCGDGTNLLSFAYMLPESRFVGIDLARNHIESAHRAASALGLKNIEFKSMDVMKVTPDSIGKFDYIIAHGLFSWVPEMVRTRVLEIYRDCLADQGVGYISYNVYPGCKIREILWDMMKFYSKDVEDPMQKVSAGLQFLNFINFAADPESAYRKVIATELSQYSQRTAENIYHDDLSELNRPFFFREFADVLEPNGLQYLCEVDEWWGESRMRPEITAKLDELGDDVVKREQYIDYILGRPFRSSVICRGSVKLDRKLSSGLLGGFYLASQAEPVLPITDLQSNSEIPFKGIDGHEASVTRAQSKAALTYLKDRWSTSVRFDELMETAAVAAGAKGDPVDPQAVEELFGLFKAGLIYLHRYRPEFPMLPGEKPAASRFVQWQIKKKCADVTALSGMNLRPSDDLMRLLLLLCDGTRTRDQIAADAASRIELPEESRDQLLAQLPAAVDERLAEFARLGLLEA